jgi:hypothetical protein
VPAIFGGTGFQPVRRTGEMPVPPRTFQEQKSRDNEAGGQWPPIPLNNWCVGRTLRLTTDPEQFFQTVVLAPLTNPHIIKGSCGHILNLEP